MSKPTRKAVGSQWRILAQSPRGARRVRLEGDGTTIFDELVIDDWLHLEQMDARDWWMRVGDVVLNVEIRRDGTTRVTVERDP